MSGTASSPLKDLGHVMPIFQEGLGSIGATHGIQRMFTVPIGPPLLVDGATYNATVFIAPCNGCVIKELWLSGVVKIASGTNTFAVDNYDASANATRNVLSTTNIDPDTITAKEGLKLTLTATAADLRMDEGDVLNATLVAGTQSTAGQGYSMMAIVVVPEIV